MERYFEELAERMQGMQEAELGGEATDYPANRMFM
jgi:hypothetical protein